MFDLALAAVTVESIVESFGADVAAAAPRFVSGFLFLAIAYVGIKLVTTVLKRALRRIYSVTSN